MHAGPLNAEVTADYARLTENAAWFTRPRTHVELAGADRAKFFHNFCTNEIRRLPEGRGCEAFITTGQGKIFDFVLVFAGADSLTLTSPPGSGERLVAHLDRYLIREQVELRDRSAEWLELVVAGPRAAELLARLEIGELPPGPWGETLVESSGRRVRVRSSAEFGVTAFALIVPSESLAHFEGLLAEAGLSQVDAAVGEILRVEAGFPAYGQDISEKNLPQELGRDDRAISFTKGCYLGQETVARIDALGHVNRTLCALSFEGAAVPSVGAALEAEGQNVGEVTSAVWSPKFDGPIGLGYVRRGQAVAGATFRTSTGSARLR